MLFLAVWDAALVSLAIGRCHRPRNRYDTARRIGPSKSVQAYSHPGSRSWSPGRAGCSGARMCSTSARGKGEIGKLNLESGSDHWLRSRLMLARGGDESFINTRKRLDGIIGQIFLFDAPALLRSGRHRVQSKLSVIRSAFCALRSTLQAGRPQATGGTRRSAPTTRRGRPLRRPG